MLMADVTLRFLGSVAEEEVESVVGALDGLAGLPRSSIGPPVVAVAGPRYEPLRASSFRGDA